MSTARVQVLHAFIAEDGKWKSPEDRDVRLPTEEARRMEERGYVDVIDVDGAPEVWAACCTGCGCNPA